MGRGIMKGGRAGAWSRIAGKLWSWLEGTTAYKTVIRWQEDDGNLMAAAVAYYAALSFFPLLLVLIAGLGLALRYTDWGQDAEQQVLVVIGDYASASLQDGVAKMLHAVQSDAGLGGPLGIAGLIFTGAALFARFEQAFDRIWNTELAPVGLLKTIRRLLFERLRAFLMLTALGPLVLVVFITDVTLAAIRTSFDGVLPGSEWVWWSAQIATSATINCGVFTLLYRWLPKVPVAWMEAFRGALVAAVLWEIGRVLLTWLLVGSRFGAYGIVGSFLAVMLWIYFAVSVILLAAEYVQVICERCNPSSLTERETHEPC